MEQIRVLQALRLKGRVPAADLPGATGVVAARCETLLAELFGQGYAEQAGERWRLTASGGGHLAELLDQERK